MPVGHLPCPAEEPGHRAGNAGREGCRPVPGAPGCRGPRVGAMRVEPWSTQGVCRVELSVGQSQSVPPEFIS